MWIRARLRGVPERLLAAAAALPAVFLSVVPTHAQEPAPYDIQHYDLRIEPDFAKKTLRVVSTLTIDNPGLAGSFTFGLSDQFHTVSVRSGDEAVPAERTPGRIAVRPAPRSRLSLTFEAWADSPRSDDEARSAIEEESLFLLWSDRFYPISFDDWATVETTVILPERFQVIAPGREVSVGKSGGGSVHVFATGHPAVAFSVFADSRWERTVQERDGLRIQTLLHPESRKYGELILATSRDVLEFYASLFGPYPSEQFSFVTLTGMGARRAFSGFIGYSPEYLAKEMSRTGLDAHETALLWWGYTSRGAGPGGWQWTEGFGDYAEVLYHEARGRPLPEIMRYFRREYLALTAEQEPHYSELRGRTPQAIVHGKYPWLMHVLRYLVGDEAFRKGMGLLFERYRFRTFSMEDLIATLEEGMGTSLATWREQWLERKGVPVVTLSWNVEPGPPYRISGSVEQAGEIYDLPLEIGIESEGGVRVERLHLKGPKQRFAFESPEKPLRVVLDPNERLLLRMVDGDPPPASSGDMRRQPAPAAGGS